MSPVSNFLFATELFVVIIIQ